MIKQAVMGVMLVALAGCELVGLLAGHGKQKAAYTLPKGKRVLVLVDMRPAVVAPPEFSEQLSERLAGHLFSNKAADDFVGQERMLMLRRDPQALAKMSVADLVRATGADVAVVVDVWDFTIKTSSDNAVSEASVQALVKVVDRTGERLWPAGDSAGEPIKAEAEPKLTGDRDQAGMLDELTSVLAVQAGRMFHDYSLDDHEMTKGDETPGKTLGGK